MTSFLFFNIAPFPLRRPWHNVVEWVKNCNIKIFTESAQTHPTIFFTGSGSISGGIFD
jgi:hypothetical protein